MKTFAALALVAVILAIVSQRVQAWPAVKHVVTKTYELTHDGVIAVDDASGDVSVVGWDSDTIELTTTTSAWSDDDLQRLGTRTDAQADHFSVAAEYPSHCFNCDVSLELRVPIGAHVSIETASGDVVIKSLAGPARVDSSSGDVECKDIGGEVHVHSSSGDVTLDGIGSSVDAYASSGDIVAHRLQADANLVASSGSVTAEFSRFDSVHAVRLESSSGDISLVVPRGVGFKIDATTASGSIDSNLHLPIHDRDSGADVTAQVGDGLASVPLRATSGDIGITMR